MNRSDDSFLSRWSRRKALARDGQSDQDRVEPAAGEDPASPEETGHAKSAEQHGTSPARTTPQNTASDTAADTAADTDRPPVAATEKDFEHIDFDALDFNSDYQRFMGGDVPDAIRNKALRKLWASNPVLANMDGLDDYCEDFSDAVWATPNIQTAYKVGQGFLTDEEVAEWQRLGQPEEKSELAVAAEPATEDLEEINETGSDPDIAGETEALPETENAVSDFPDTRPEKADAGATGAAASDSPSDQLRLRD